VATHNHFVLDRGGKVFNRSAPIIKLPSNATEEDHLALLGLLNSSTACFWMKQVFHNKGSTVDEKGARQTTVAFENFYEFTGTGLQRFPITADNLLDLANTLDRLAQEWQTHLPGHWYTELMEQEGWVVERLTPLLAGIAELIPWLKQWHNDIDSDYHERMGDFFEIFLHGQLQQCGLTREDLKRWQPSATGRAHGRRRGA